VFCKDNSLFIKLQNIRKNFNYRRIILNKLNETIFTFLPFHLLVSAKSKSYFIEIAKLYQWNNKVISME